MMVDGELAYKLAEMASWADDGCSYCVSGICASLNKIFPEWHWEVPEGDAKFREVPEGFGINVVFWRVE